MDEWVPRGWFFECGHTNGHYLTRIGWYSGLVAPISSIVEQSWASYFNNVIYYILLVTLLKSNAITVTYYCFGKVTSNILRYILLYNNV